jgi:transcriptional regulator with XRE-family HTH domain
VPPGNAVRAERQKRKLTLDQFGELLDKSDGRYVGELERGFHSPTLTTAKEIADALGVPLARLVKGI